MPKTVPVQNNFAAGEISPRFIAQIDQEVYKHGVESLVNFIPMAQGPVYRRNGYRYHGQVPGSNARLFAFPITAQFVCFIIITDEGKMYVGSPDELFTSGNFVANPNFLSGSTSWTDISLNSGYVTFQTGSCTLYPGASNPALDNRAGVQQAVTITNGAIDHRVDVVTGATGVVADMTIRIGSTAGGNDIMETTVGSAVTHFIATFDPLGYTTLYIDVVAEENDLGATRIVSEVSIKDPASEALVEFTTPWGPDELAGIQVGYPPGQDRIYFVSQSDPIQQLTFNRTTGNFTFAATTITNAPSAWTTSNYPGTITFFQGRMWVGGTPNEPETFWASKSGSYLNFDLGTGLADEGIAFTMAQKGAIRWMVGAKNLLIGTEFGEFIVTSEFGVIQPGDRQVDQQSAYGSARIQPVQIGNRVLYVSPDRRKIRDMGYKWTEDGWVSRDITFASEHITYDSQIKELTFAQNPGNLVQCVSLNRQLLGGTYERGNDIVGWYRSQSDGEAVSLASVDLNGTSLVATLFNRNIEATNTLYYEVCYPAPTGGACVVDSGDIFGGDPDGDDITAVSVPHLKNKTVRVIVDGALHPDITLDASGDGDLNYAGKTVVVGLAYTATMQTLPLATTLQVGQSTLPMMKRYNKIYVRIFNSAYPKINGSRPPTRNPSTPMNMPEPLVTADIKVVNTGWDRYARILIEQDLPLFTNIAGIYGEAAQEELG